MIALIQRVLSASVTVAGESVGAIGPGLLALVAVQPHDGEAAKNLILGFVLAFVVLNVATCAPVDLSKIPTALLIA